MDSFCFSPIALVRSPYLEKFAVPRQPGLVKSARAQVCLLPPYDDPACVDGLEGCSHIWLQFVFHKTAAEGWQPRVRPPRLGGNKRLGVFATRSNFRPNPLGLSVVKLEAVHDSKQGLSLEVSGIDLIDGTPVLDIKPYVPYADAIADATNVLAPDAPVGLLQVHFSAEVVRLLSVIDETGALRGLIEGLLELDPRPAYKQGEDRGEYGFRLMGYNVRWRMSGQNSVEVVEITSL